MLSFPSTYHANGKLLLTGEYLVLHGAKAIALPLKVGQQMEISEDDSSKSLNWQAFYRDKVWFECRLDSVDFSVLETSDPDKAQTLTKLFQVIRKLNPEFLPQAGTRIQTILEANPAWGFGSSSTLVSLLAQWSGVDPFALNELVFKGSGFDVACAAADGPVFYVRNKPVEPVALNYSFDNQLFLVYSGRKMKTANAVASFLKEKTVSELLIGEMSALSDEFAVCSDRHEFDRLIRKHEQMIGRLVGKEPVKQAYFQDFDGEVKSLGAWGGDFFLVSTELPFSGVKKYVENKGLTTVFRWKDLILKRQKP